MERYPLIRSVNDGYPVETWNKMPSLPDRTRSILCILNKLQRKFQRDSGLRFVSP
jgi:hypothetical protein